MIMKSISLGVYIYVITVIVVLSDLFFYDYLPYFIQKFWILIMILCLAAILTYEILKRRKIKK